MMFTLFVGFLLGAFTILLVQVLGLLLLIGRLGHGRKQDSESPLLTRDLDLHQSLDSAYKKQGVIWILEPEKVPTFPQIGKIQRDAKKKKEILEVFPMRKYARIKDRSLILTESDGSYTAIPLKGCTIVAVSATDLPSKKWAKKYPIKVESKTLEIYNGSKTFYLYLETSWEKESWCKALRLASSNDKDRLSWHFKLSEDFSGYLTSLNGGYASFMKTSIGFCAEPIDRESRQDGSSSKVRHFLKKLTKKASRINVENKAISASSSSQGAITGKTLNSSSEENMVPPSSSTVTHSGSQNHMSINSDTDPEDKFSVDEGMLCWNLLISRLFFDAKRSEEIKSFLQARIQSTLSNMRTPSYIGEITCTNIRPGNLPPYIHGIRVLPMDMTEAWAFEIDIEYSGGLVLDIETRLEVHELDLQKGLVDSNLESSSVEEVTSDLLEGFEHYGKQLNLSEGTVNVTEHKDEGDPKLVVEGIKSSRSTTRTSIPVSRWKSIVNAVARHVPQVPLAMAIRVTSLRGTVRLHIKPPPSDRLWFGFSSMPDIDFHLESSIGEHKITISHIVLFLTNRFKAAIRDTLVLPNCESVCIPWMLAEKDDWVQRNVAPFIWINQEAVTDANTMRDVPSSQPVESGEYVTKPVSEPSDALSSLNSDDLSTLRSRSLQESQTALLRNDEPQETCQSSRWESLDCQSLSGSEVTAEEQNHTIEESDTRPKRMGRKARMLDLGKKMGEKLEEKRRNIEEKGRNIVERMRGP
ncbi:unnamed protein product, partial [Vitis vinifera]